MCGVGGVKTDPGSVPKVGRRTITITRSIRRGLVKYERVSDGEDGRAVIAFPTRRNAKPLLDDSTTSRANTSSFNIPASTPVQRPFVLEASQFTRYNSIGPLGSLSSS